MFSNFLKFGALCMLLCVAESLDNILLNKTILVVSDYPTYATNINDGNIKNCMWFEEGSKKMIAFDLGKSYKINKIVVSNGNYRARLPAYFYIGNNFQACKFKTLMTNYGICGPLIQNSGRKEITCNGPSNVGRYLVLLKGNPFDYEVFERLYLCDIMVYGDEDDQVEQSARPTITSVPIPPITKNNFKIAPVIRNNVPTVTIPYYSNGVIFVNKNCEPIIYDIITSLAFGVACQTNDGKGRIAVFAKSSYFKGLFTDPTMVQFKTNLQKWLSPNTRNAQYIMSEDIKTMSNFDALVTPGIIVIFDVWNPCPDDILTKLKSYLLTGKISIVIDITFWVSNTIEARNSYLQILNIFNVDFTSTYITWSSVLQSTLPDDLYKESLIGIEEIFNRMLLNHDYFISNGPAITKILSQYPPSILLNSQLSNNAVEIVKKYKKLLEWICPCDLQKSSDLNDRNIIKLFGELMKSQLLVNSGIKAPCVDSFPGDFVTTPQKVSVTLDLVGVTSSTKNPIGYYLEAGSTLDYSVIQSSGTWTMHVGCHTDYLPDSLAGWARYPSIYVSDVPITSSGQIYSGFGGVLWLYNKEVNASITIKLSNVIPTPFFNLRDPNAVSNWMNKRNNPGLWGQIAGDSMILCEQSKKLKKYDGDYLVNLMQNSWDKVVRMEFLLTMYDWKIQRPEITVLDVMISAGYGHSGYPIELYPDWHDAVFNSTYIKNLGSWGMCHELGHNRQRSKWTFSGTGEVTNNLQCLFVFDKLYKISRYGTDLASLGTDTTDIKAYLDGGADFNQWKSSPWKALLIHSQFVKHFGWGFYKSVFEYYEINNIDPSTNDLKIITFMNITSITAQQNLIPIFDFWGFPIDSSLNQYLSTLPCFFPTDDFIIMLSDIRKNYIKTKYPKCNSKSLNFKDFNPDPLIEGMRPNFIKETNVVQI